jgi:TatD DNase family protein
MNGTATTPGWTDTHCHVLDDKIPDGPDAALDAARSAGVTRFVVIGTDAATSEGAVALAARHDDVWATIGLHPHDAVAGVDSLDPILRAAADDPASRVVAIGECGLDHHYDHSPRAVQREAFARQIEIARESSLSLVVHTRDAWSETFDILDAHELPEGVVIHCFTGGPDEARACLDRGAWLSFSGIVTFKNAGDIREAVRLCPLDRLLVETDSPYLAPVPHRGRPNQPAHVALVGEAVARIKGLEPAEIAASSSRAALLAFPRLGS